MEVTQQQVKEWLAQYPDRDRHWLAEKCDTEKATVDNWLSSARGIPSKARIIIESLMRADREAERAKNPAPPMSLVLEVSPATFDAYNRAATAEGMIIREWAIHVLDQAAERDRQQKLAAIAAPITVPAPGKVVELPTPSVAKDPAAFEVPAARAGLIMILGSVAAGGKGSADVEETEMPVGKNYPANHYALRVRGRSMEPAIPDGSIIVVKRFQDMGFPRAGTIVVYNDGEGSTLKVFDRQKPPSGSDAEHASLGKIPVLHSINPEYPDVDPIEGGRIDAIFVELLPEEN